MRTTNLTEQTRIVVSQAPNRCIIHVQGRWAICITTLQERANVRRRRRVWFSLFELDYATPSYGALTWARNEQNGDNGGRNLTIVCVTPAEQHTTSGNGPGSTPPSKHPAAPSIQRPIQLPHPRAFWKACARCCGASGEESGTWEAVAAPSAHHGTSSRDFPSLAMPNNKPRSAVATGAVVPSRATRRRELAVAPRERGYVHF